TITLSDLGGVTAGDYIIFDYNGAALANINNLSLASPVFGKLLPSLINDTGNTNILLRLTNGPQWLTDGGGSWGIASNWLPSSVPTLVANFLNNLTIGSTVT